eukprot:TRINITY_DN26018_c0_g1_i4.p4 TRINITY_DN26018_c0_g1~~TRINITY_DN26018_c0_g1_i4.p4  ORF type:complete len:111 (-),score=17.89 TRINITY_DN26018_c0_g1_i4:554-886(-)
MFIFFFSSRRRHTRCREVSWARRCVQETGIGVVGFFLNCLDISNSSQERKGTDISEFPLIHVSSPTVHFDDLQHSIAPHSFVRYQSARVNEWCMINQEIADGFPVFVQFS